MSSSQPPQKSSDMIVMTRLNTVGLKRLAEGSLVEKAPLDSRPPLPSRPPPPVALKEPPKAAAPNAVIFDAEDALQTQEHDASLGADAAEDRTIARSTGTRDEETQAIDTAAAKAPAAAPSQPPPKAKVTSPLAFAATLDGTTKKPKSDPPGVVVDPRLEIETPTALFVKDIQATLKEELAKQQQQQQRATHDKSAETKAPPKPAVFEMPPLDIAPLSESHAGTSRGRARTEPAPDELPNFDAPTKIEPKTALTKNVPPPPTSKPASLAPPAKPSGSSLPAPLPAQANRRKDPAGVSVAARPTRIERKGGFAPWAAALTALGVFVGVAGARVATGAPFARAAQPAPVAAPAAAPAAEPGFAPRVVVPEQKPTETAAAAPAQEAKPEEAAKPAEPPKEEAKPVVEAKKVEPEPAKAEPVKAAEPEKVVHAERPRPRRERPQPAAAEEKPAPKPVVAEKPEPKAEPVAAKPKPEKAEKPEAPAKPASKSPDVAAAARDYAAVESQLGQSL